MENYVIAGMGNYVIADPTNLGNFMIADTTAGLIRIARSTESFRFCRVNVTSSRWISVAMETPISLRVVTRKVILSPTWWRS